MFNAFATSLSFTLDSTNLHHSELLHCIELLCRQLSADQLSPRILQLWQHDYCLQALNKLWQPKFQLLTGERDKYDRQDGLTSLFDQSDSH